MARITAVCVVHALLPNPPGSGVLTAIDKRPVGGRVAVGPLGLAGDRQMDTVDHGGADQAVYLYADEDAAWWAAELGRDIPPGLFGENLRTSGIDLSATRIGQRLRIGDSGLVVEVTAARNPCVTFARRMAEPHWVKRFTQHRAPGAYVQVATTGTVAAGDAILAFPAPDHDVTVADILTPPKPGAMARLVDAERSGAVELSVRLRRAALRSAASPGATPP